MSAYFNPIVGFVWMCVVIFLSVRCYTLKNRVNELRYEVDSIKRTIGTTMPYQLERAIRYTEEARLTVVTIENMRAALHPIDKRTAVLEARLEEREKK